MSPARNAPGAAMRPAHRPPPCGRYPVQSGMTTLSRAPHPEQRNDRDASSGNSPSLRARTSSQTSVSVVASRARDRHPGDPHSLQAGEGRRRAGRCAVARLAKRLTNPPMRLQRQLFSSPGHVWRGNAPSVSYEGPNGSIRCVTQLADYALFR
jgi:hypothetical protein